MKISFPYMGTTIIYKKVLELLGHEVIMPPKPTQRTLDLGVKYSPEFACFPLKVITGTYIEALEKGAEFLITSGGHGPCRAGFYHEVHQRILNNLGYNNEILVFNSIKNDFWGFLKTFLKVKNKKPFKKVKSVIKTCYLMAKSIDKIEKIVTTNRAYEVKRGEHSRAWEKIKKMYDENVHVPEDVARIEMESLRILNSIELKEVPDHEKIRIGIIGEIYVVMEPSVNMDIEERLNNLGAEVERSQYLSEWIEFNLVPKRYSKSIEYEILEMADDWIEIPIGGHAKQSVGSIVYFKERGFDGVIQLMPFGCLPELVGESIIPKMSEELDIPIMSLSLDEHTGTANIQTRIEAFLDLVKSVKSDKKKKNNIISIEDIKNRGVKDKSMREGVL